MGSETRYSYLPSNSWCSLFRTRYSRLPEDNMCSRYRTGCDWDKRNRRPDYSLRETGDRDVFDSMNESANWSDLDNNFLNDSQQLRDEDDMRLPSLSKHEEYDARNATLDLRILKEKLLLKEEKIEKMKQEIENERGRREQTLSILFERNQKMQLLEREKTDDNREIENLQRTNRRQDEEINNCRKEIMKLENELSNENLQRLSFENETNKIFEIQEAELMKKEAELMKKEAELKQIVDNFERQLGLLEQQYSMLFEDLTITKNLLQNKTKDYNTNQHLLQLLQEQNTEKENSIRNLRATISKLEDEIWKRQSQATSRLEIMNQEQRSEIGHLRKKINDLREKVLQRETSTATKGKDNMSMRYILPQMDDDKSNYKAMIEEMQRQLREKKLEMHQLLQDKTTLMADIKIHQKKSDKLQEEVGELRGENELIRKQLMQEKETAKLKENECISLRKIMTRTQGDEVQKQLNEQNSELHEKVEQLVQDKKKLTEQLRYLKETEKKKESHDFSKLQDESRNLQKEVDRLRHENQILNNKLKLELENFHLKEQTLNSIHHNVKTQKEEISKLKAEVENERQMNSENQSNVRKLLQEKKDLTKELTKKREIEETTENYGNTTLKCVSQTLQDDVTKLRLQNQLLNDSIRQEKEKVKQIEKETKVHNSDMQKQMEIQASEILALKQKLKEMSVQNSKTYSRVSKNQGLDQDLQKRHEDAMDQVKHLQKELEETKSRLSRAMGDRLTDNNPNIADLSDKNRPTKLSERFQELYDNQWTDAFEIINVTFGDEGNTINALRMILMDALEYCKTQAVYQMNQIKETFLKGDEFPANMIKQVKECRKAMAEQYGKGLYREYYDQLRTSKSEKALHAIKTPSYVKECFEVCWLMAVQDPPVVFGPDTRRGDNFNKDHYRPYTRSGERVDFVVWPVLLLHQNGPVLCKGVAQGK